LVRLIQSWPARGGTGLGNYNINYTPGTLTVNPAPLTITPDAPRRRIRHGLQPLHRQCEGLKNGDAGTVTYASTWRAGAAGGGQLQLTVTFSFTAAAPRTTFITLNTATNGFDCEPVP